MIDGYSHISIFLIFVVVDFLLGGGGGSVLKVIDKGSRGSSL